MLATVFLHFTGKETHFPSVAGNKWQDPGKNPKYTCSQGPCCYPMFSVVREEDIND